LIWEIREKNEYIPLLFLLIQYSSKVFFFIVIQIIVLLSLYEFYNLSRKKRIYPKRALGMILALLIGGTFLLDEFSLGLALLAGLFILTVVYLISIKRLEELMAFPAEAALTFFGAFYLSFTMNHIVLLRQDFGPFSIYFLLTIVFAGDTGAFLIGKKWGKHKMVSLASPHKTWEGSVAGIVFGIVFGVAAGFVLFGKDFLIWKVVLVAFMIQVVVQLSDPLESLFKRAAGVKDSSHILPGHGGMLDRTDSLVLAIPFFYYVLKYLGMS
jgi:phosphatidate cytidylyltransferase